MHPLVSCIMPCSRPDDLKQAILLFIAQDYPNKELLILMDGEGYTLNTSIEHRIHQWGVPGLTIGAKRNHLCQYAHGDIIFHLDSDDYYAPDWISTCVPLMDEYDLIGMNKAYFYNPQTRIGKYYDAKNRQPYCLGATMCYRKAMWEKNKFNEHVAYGEDAMFCGNAGRIGNHNYIDGFTALIHGNNTCSHNAFVSMPIVPRENIPYVRRYQQV